MRGEVTLELVFLLRYFNFKGSELNLNSRALET